MARVKDKCFERERATLFFCSPDRGFPDLNAAVALVRGNKILVLFAEEGKREELEGVEIETLV